MADVGIEQLKEDIQADIKANNNQTITGDLLQERLIDTVDTLKGYTDDHVSVSQNTLKIGDTEVGELGGQYIDNKEYIEAVVDNEDKIIEATKPDGTKVFSVKVEAPEVSSDKILLQGKEISSASTVDVQYIIDDKEERVEIATDADGKVVSYRDKQGVLHEMSGFSTNSLKLTESGMTEFQQALKDSGFQPGGHGDWSDYISEDGKNPLCLSEPRCATINLNTNISLSGLLKKGMTGAQKGVNYDVPCELEFYDMQGNYFKKWVAISGQGNSSMMFPMKNIAFDLFDEQSMDAAFKVKFGDWVSQDSFHLKAFYADFLKGTAIVAYKIAMQAQKTRGFFNDVAWKKALINPSDINANPMNSDLTDFELQMNTGARCMPDGFPIIVYQNGEFYGIYTLCIKKHRDNYHMSKSNPKHIHLDGDLKNDTIFNGVVDWTQFEVRNPKDLYYKEAHIDTSGRSTFKYDADDPGQFEIADQATVDAWINAGQLPDGTVITSKIEKNLKNTAKVHKYVTDLSGHLGIIESGATEEEKKALFETYFDADNIIDYELINLALNDRDGFGPNWQWTCWDGVKWYVNEYDKDNSFGYDSKGFLVRNVPNPANWFGYGVFPTQFVIDHYLSDIKARWTELVSDGIFTTSNFMQMINEWTNRIGYSNYERQYKEKWPDTPCCRASDISPNWELVSIDYSPGSQDNYNPSTNYMIGDECTLYEEAYLLTFRCIVDNTLGVFPCRIYPDRPQFLGFYDNIWRFKKFIDENLSAVSDFITNV